MTTMGGTPDAQLRLVVALDAPKPQAADEVSSAVRRLRTATLDAQWHSLLGDVYASLGSES